jgi:4-diphosphocytidyl-2C-methyl-D-erythritol kinase
MIPPYSCETSEVYRAFDALEYHETNSGNDLLTPACVVEPRLATDMETATTLLDQEIHLSGSGSTMFAICDNAEHAAETAKKLEEHTELVAIATQTCEEVLERI